MQNLDKTTINSNSEMDHPSLTSLELQPMDIAGGAAFASRRRRNQGLVPLILNQFKSMQQMSEVQILAELSVWAAVFALLGMVAAYHRMTL